MNQVTRRDAIFSSLLAGTGYWSAANISVANTASSKLNVAVIGAGMGSVGGIANLPAMRNENVVAICDVDEQYAGPAFDANPNARRWKDFRKMLDEHKDIEAVVISTPDHLHAPIGVMAMRMGKHVYCEKPLARTIHELV